MVPDDDKISSIQVGVFVFNIILGVGVLTLPSNVVKEAENNAWLVTLLAGPFSLLFIYLMCKTANRNGRKGFIETLRILFGKILGTILAIPVCIYFFIFLTVEIRTFAETTKLYLLNNTPLEFIVFPLIILAVFLGRSGVEPIARFFEALTPITLIIIILLFLVALPKSDYSNLLPIFPIVPNKFFMSFRTVLFSFSGFEILLIIFPFIRKPREAFKASAIAVAIITVIYSVEIIQCLSRFGVNETAAQIYPVITLIRSSEIPGGLIERMEGLLLAIWVVFVYTTVVAIMFGLSQILGDLFKQKKRKHIAPMLIPIIYIGVLQAQSVVDISDINDKLLSYFGIYSYLILPVVMFIMTMLRGIGGAKNEV